jgi:hypothetical protein
MAAHIQVSFTTVGAVNDPQKKITQVQVEYARETLRFLNNVKPQTFLISLSVTYRKVEQPKQKDLILPPPGTIYKNT